MVNMYLYSENELHSICGSKVTAQTERQIDTQTHILTDTQPDTQTNLSEIITNPHMQMVTMLRDRQQCRMKGNNVVEEIMYRERQQCRMRSNNIG